MIVSGGMNVFPAEVEAAMADVPGLVEFAVFGVPHERWGETVVAVAVTSDPSLDEAAVIAAARDRIASYKKPTEVRFVDRPAPHRQPQDRQAGAARAVGRPIRPGVVRAEANRGWYWSPPLRTARNKAFGKRAARPRPQICVQSSTTVD